MKTRPGLVIIDFAAVTLSRIGYIVNIDDVGGAFRYGCDDPETGWRDRTQDRRQRVGSREVWVLVWAARVGVEGRDRQWRL